MLQSLQLFICRPAFYLPTGKFSVAVKCCPIIFQLKEGVDNAFKYLI